MNVDDQDTITREEFEALRNEILRIREDLAALSKSSATDHKGLHVLRKCYEGMFDTTETMLRDLCERVKMLEPRVYPKLGENFRQINNIIKPVDGPEPKLPSPPRK